MRHVFYLGLQYAYYKITISIMLDSKEVIKSCMNKNEASFRILVESYSEYAFSTAFRILNEEEESKDVVQESFMAVWQQIGSFNIEKNFTNWFYRIIVNKCYDSLRKKKRNPLVHPDSGHWNMAGMISDSSPDRRLNNEETGFMIQRLTNRLSPKQKVIFILHELEERSQDDIAEITGMAKTAIKSNLNHARRNIGKMIKKYLGE